MTATQRSVDRDRTALITGASRGIGYELAKLFADDGYDVVLVARSQEKLEEVAKELEDTYSITAAAIPMDLSVPEAADELYDTVTSKNIQVDALVNNAALASYGHFCETDIEREREVLHLNVIALTELTKLFARTMCERGDGRILNVSSLGGALPTPKLTVYSATKAYVYSFSVALANELAEDGITVTVLVPGNTDTGMLERRGVENSAIPESDLNDPQEVAREGYDGLQQGETIVVPGGIKEKLLFELPRILPKTTTATVARKATEGE